MRRVWTFFYGSFMNADVLAQAGVYPSDRQAAQLDGWELKIAPRATLIPAPRSRVYGVLGQMTHEDLDRVYAKDWFGFGAYLPEAVIVTAAARQAPALCYIAWKTEGGKPTRQYIQKMVAVAREHCFPEEYVRHIESFLQMEVGG